MNWSFFWSFFWSMDRSSQRIENAPSLDQGTQSVCSVSYGFSRMRDLGYNSGLEFIIERTLR